jgi:hypothetical protein
MKCYYTGHDAIGLCKACGRGLSLPAATEFPLGLACRGRCETEVQRLIPLHHLNARTQALNAIISGGFSALAGAGFLYFSDVRAGFSLMGFMGAAFVLYGVVTGLRAAFTYRKLRTTPASCSHPSS